MDKRHSPLPGGLFLPGLLLYDELLLHAWVGGSFALPQLLPLLLLTAALGFALGLAACLLPARAERVFTAAAALVLAVYFLTEYFLNVTFSCFMPPAMLFRQAGGVAADFMDVVLALIGGNLLPITAMLLPVVLYLLCGTPVPLTPRMRALPALAAAVCAALGLWAAAGFSGLGSLTDQFSFDAAARQNGLGVSTVLELSRVHQKKTVSLTIPDEPLPTVHVPQTVPTTSPEPEAQSEPMQAEPAQPHVLPIDYTDLTGFRDLCGYVAAQVPSTDNAYTGMFRGKNLILITAEAFTAQVIDAELTPTLYRMANAGIRFTNFYQPGWNGGTTGGEMSIIGGLVPDPSMAMDNFSRQKPFITIGHRLMELGYFSRAYHNHAADFYDRMNTHADLGYEQFIAMYTGMEEGVTNKFPQSDLEMIDFTVPQYIDHQPFSVYYMTVSGHSVYSAQHPQVQKNYAKVADSHWSEPVRYYMAAQLELENAMCSLLRQLEEAGIADDTVVVLAGDHYPYGLNGGDSLFELYGVEPGALDNFTRDRSAAIIWSGCLEGQNIRVDAPCSTLDLLPTLCNLFDVEYDSRLLIGRDVFSDAPALVLWPDYSWITELGSYNALAHRFTPVPDAQVPDDYIQTVSAIVKGKIQYSHAAIANGFFAYLRKYLPQQPPN